MFSDYTKLLGKNELYRTNTKDLYRDHLAKGGWMWRMEQHQKSWRFRIWWKFAKGPTIHLAVPIEYSAENNQLYIEHGILPSDVFFYYEPWLLENVGRKGWEWDWMIEFQNQKYPLTYITLKFREPTKFATHIALKWGINK